MFPDLVRRRLDEVQNFHAAMLSNRRRFLSQEMDRLRRAIASRRSEVGGLSDERAQLMVVLTKHGALDEFTTLQDQHARLLAELQDIDNRIRTLKAFDEGKSEVAIAQQVLLQEARRDLEDREPSVRRAIEIFNANSESLYDAPGSLVIEAGKTGYKFDVQIERSGSQGIGSMKIFCYDLMLAELWASEQPSPGFLMHDSTLFDGVDERQKALALELAAAKSAASDFQYICTLNSDEVPSADLSPNFDLTRFVRLELSDDRDEGRLLGIRY